MSTALVGLAALPGLAIAQSDQADNSMTQEQTETDSQVETDTEAGTGAGSDTDTESDMEGGAQSDTDMGGASQSGSGDDQSDSSTSSATGTDDGRSSDMGSDMGSGSDDMKSGDKPEVSEGHSEVDPSTVEASAVDGAPVMSRDGEEIANVSDVLLTEDGSIDSVIVNVGGVLGIGSKPVEIPFDEVTLQSRDENDEMSIVIPMSQQDLEDMPEYKES